MHPKRRLALGYLRKLAPALSEGLSGIPKVDRDIFDLLNENDVVRPAQLGNGQMPNSEQLWVFIEELHHEFQVSMRKALLLWKFILQICCQPRDDTATPTAPAGRRLLHAGADGVIVVFRFDDGDRDARLVEEKVIGLPGFTALDRLAANDDTALGEVDLFPQLGHHILSAAVWTDQRGSDEFRADIRFGESLLIHGFRSIREPTWHQGQCVRHGRW